GDRRRRHLHERRMSWRRVRRGGHRDHRDGRQGQGQADRAETDLVQVPGPNLGPVIVLEAKLVLGEESPAKLKELQSRLFRWRKAGTPYDQPCCGSVFKNPSLTRTAGMLIDEAGLKGHTVGGAQVSSLHANYFINLGNATAA